MGLEQQVWLQAYFIKKDFFKFLPDKLTKLLLNFPRLTCYNFNYMKGYSCHKP
jgi:hypothetical protein